MTTQVIIKYATQNTEDFNISCEMTWTIALLKDKLSALHPMKPKREHQKLIYGGKLLPDHLPLKSVLNQSQDIHIIHLVCPPPDISDRKISKENKPSVSAAPVPPTINPSGVYPQMNEHLLGSSSLTNGGMPTNVWSSPTDVSQQYLVAQQMYMQMMSQYYAQMSGTVPYGPIVPPMVQQTPPEVNRPNAPANPQPWQNEEDHRDYIDYLYTFSRMIMLAALLLYYSSASRVFGVLVMIFLLSILGKLNRHRRREEQLVRARQNSEQVPLEQAPDDSPADENEQATEETSTHPDAASQPLSEAPPSPPSPTSVPSTIFTLVTAFFSSLIPSDPMPPVNVN